MHSSFDALIELEKTGRAMPIDFAVWRADVAPEISSAVHHVDRYFERKRGGRTFNKRADLNPSDLAPYLPYITLIDVIDKDEPGPQCIEDGRFRLVGTKVAVLYGNATDRLVSEHHSEEILGRVRLIADFCISEKSPAVGRSAALANGRPSIEVTLLYVPLSEDDERVSQFMIFADICSLDSEGKRQGGDRLPEAIGGH
jgi:hypothetical protein